MQLSASYFATHCAPSTAPRRILLVCTQRIGDVLLTTPLARSLKQAWPDAQLDMLVLPGTQGVLEGNPDIHQIIALPQRVGLREKLGQLRSLWRRYDLALSPLPTDRARLFCWSAGRYRLGVCTAQDAKRAKALLLNTWAPFDDLDTHTVSMGLRLAELLGIAPCHTVVALSLHGAQDQALQPLRAALGNQPYAVLHPYPKFNYKMWTPTGWVALARWLRARGLAVVLTGGPDADECAYVAAIAREIAAPAATPGDQPPVLNLAGSLSLAATAEILRTAKLHVGPDTAVTHLAAAVGIPTLALFGPSNPVKWGPWPGDWNSSASPWSRRGSGRQGNVYLLQGEHPRGCVPCLLEGCQRRSDSYSDCLRELTVETVIAAARTLLPN